MANFENTDSVIAIPERFKGKLGIGEDAYKSLRRKKNMGKVLTAGTGAAAGSIAASSPFVATTFFSAPGLLGLLGIGAAATPIGWIIAGGAATAVAGLGIHRFLTGGKKDRVDIIPKWINTPMDVLALRLFEFLAPLYLKVAFSDRRITDTERECICDYFIEDCGYSKKFVREGLTVVERDIESFDIENLTKNVIKFMKESPDCDYSSMAKELKNFLNIILHSDSIIDDQGSIIVKWIEEKLNEEMW